MVELLREHGVNDAELIGNTLQPRHGIGEPDPGLAVAGKLSRRAKELRGAGREGETLSLDERIRTGLAVALDQLGFVVVEIQMRRRASQVQVNHPLRLGRVVGLARCQGIDDVFRYGLDLPSPERRKRQRSEAERGILEEMPAGL